MMMPCRPAYPLWPVALPDVSGCSLQTPGDTLGYYKQTRVSKVMASNDRDNRSDELEDDAPAATEAGAAVAEPDENVFWQVYSPRFEMPISYVLAALLMAIFVALGAVLVGLHNTPTDTKPGARIGTVDGPDDTGEGSEGAGGDINPVVIGANTPTQDDIKNILPNPDMTLPKVQEDMTNKLKLEDPNSSTPIAANNAAALSALDSKIQDMLMGIGTKKGSGGPGAEGENEKGTGKGGTGSDSTRSRSLRWVITFSTRGGQDYLDQLQALGAVIFVPIPGESNKFMTYANLANPGKGDKVSEAEVAKHIAKMQFHDFRRESIREVSEALGLNFTPKSFIAFFPKSFEDDLAKKEAGYQQRRSADIEETKFQVVRRAGNYEIHVTGQTLKK